MWASVRRYKVQGSVTDLAKRAQTELVPILKQNPGFVAYYIVDGGDGHLASISLFDSAWSAHRSNEQAASWVGTQAKEELPERPQITSGEVLVGVTH
ncbi:MAG: hypothetical protein MUE49_12585 [Rhodospirillales bacterium]|jgi:hypothetical protein|nr:hypothetical protein [Rhodospirillales bacterium]